MQINEIADITHGTDVRFLNIFIYWVTSFLIFIPRNKHNSVLIKSRWEYLPANVTKSLLAILVLHIKQRCKKKKKNSFWIKKQNLRTYKTSSWHCNSIQNYVYYMPKIANSVRGNVVHHFRMFSETSQFQMYFLACVLVRRYRRLSSSSFIFLLLDVTSSKRSVLSFSSSWCHQSTDNTHIYSTYGL